MKSSLVALVCAAFVSVSATHAVAATYYIGAFAGSSPADDATCGTGMGASPNAHPCKTLAYWHQTRNVADNGDTVRVAPGAYTSTSSYHCLDVEKKGVTYRGSTDTGDDTADRSLVVIAGSSSGESPCRGAVVKFVFGNSQNVTIRDLTVNGCPNADNGHCMEFSAQPSDGTLAGLTIANVRVTKAVNAGLWVGAYDDSPGPNGELSEPFNSTDVTIVDSEFDGNCFQTSSNGAGIQIAAVNGGLIARNRIHDNVPCASTPTGSVPNQTCTRKALPPACPNDDCNCDGLHIGGRNITVAANEIYSNEEDGVDIGPNGAANDCPKTTARFHTFEKNVIHDNGVDDFSMNGCSHDLVVRNNIIYGDGKGINQYECAGYNSVFYNNTVRTLKHALFTYSTMWPVSFKNNIFLSFSQNSTIWLDAGTTSPGSTWENNVVLNLGTGKAARADFMAGNRYPNCETGSGTNCCTDPDGPGSNGPIPSVGRTTSVDYTNADLAKWQADGRDGNLFGPETGATDRWANPTFVNDKVPSANNLRLQASDTVAHNNGALVIGITADIDGIPRPLQPPWDIGASQVPGNAAPLAPTLLSVDPVS